MYNIWGFFLQTISVSIIAGIILLLKRIFEDKLSPRWQYGIWSLLAIRILVPVNIGRYVIPQLALGLELLKSGVENTLSSVYASVYEPITVHHIIPMITKAPQSITDWLFAIYIAGVVFFLLKYLIAYIRLRVLLKHGSKANSRLEEKMISVCDTYNLNACKIVAVHGLSSAFICGVFRPILAVPAESDIDEKVLLHELLHLKHHDTIQNITWCVLRSLHWCNPLMHLIINTIENDLESMCDQCVLELLEGEERREYGHILLSMANQKYARIPGTTSISNGGSNISKRIAAIVRFKKYPQGMALVSVCIILTMFWPTIIGTAATYDAMDYMYYNEPFDKSMAIARINRCSTVAGAIDMYAKGLHKMNGAYVATASPTSEHARIAAELEEYGCYQPGKYIGNIEHLYDFYVYNLAPIGEKEYTGVLCYYAIVYYDEYTPELKEYVLNGEEGENCKAYILLPISIFYDDGWCVKEIGERSIVAEEDYKNSDNDILCPITLYGKNDVGEIKLTHEAKYEINHKKRDGVNIIYGDEWTTLYPVDMSPSPNAKFSYQHRNKYLTYTHLLDEVPHSYIELKVYDEFEINEDSPIDTAWRMFKSTDDWKGFISGGAGGGGSLDGDIDEIELLPTKYIAKLNIGGVDMEDINLKEVTD